MMPATPSATAPAAAIADLATQAAQREAALQRVAHLFRRAGSDVTMQALSRAVAEYRTEKLPCSR
jgi:N-methylhydantoinase B/oxoprolinase/acetone carboxylase alpha subunit